MYTDIYIYDIINKKELAHFSGKALKKDKFKFKDSNGKKESITKNTVYRSVDKKLIKKTFYTSINKLPTSKLQKIYDDNVKYHLLDVKNKKHIDSYVQSQEIQNEFNLKKYEVGNLLYSGKHRIDHYVFVSGTDDIQDIFKEQWYKRADINDRKKDLIKNNDNKPNVYKKIVRKNYDEEPVYQFDLLTGEFIKEWENYKVAEEKLGYTSTIYQNIKNIIYRCDRYVFSLNKDMTKEEIADRLEKTRMTPIYKVDLRNTEIHSIYTTLQEAVDDTVHCTHHIMADHIDKEKLLSGYFYTYERLSTEDIEKLKQTKFKKFVKNQFASPLYQYDIETYEKINTYPSINKAVVENELPSIRDVLLGKQNFAGGYLWSKIDLHQITVKNIVTDIMENKDKRLPFYMIDIDKEVVAGEYDNMDELIADNQDLVDEGLVPKRIYNIKDQPNNSYKGYMFTTRKPSEYEVKEMCRVYRTKGSFRIVYKIDIKTGKIVKKYYSVKEIVEEIGTQYIWKVLREKENKIYDGYIYTEKVLSKTEIDLLLNKSPNPSKKDNSSKYYKIDLARKTVIKAYNSLEDICDETGVDRIKLKNAIYLSSFILGYIWIESSTKPTEKELEKLYNKIFKS